ncbi:unnamed protein product, partial [Ectocarpus sp. 12 AP-2014]
NRRVAQKHQGSQAPAEISRMVASAQSASGMGEGTHVTISQATSNKHPDFRGGFDWVFSRSTLRAGGAFRFHCSLRKQARALPTWKVSQVYLVGDCFHFIQLFNVGSYHYVGIFCGVDDEKQD